MDSIYLFPKYVLIKTFATRVFTTPSHLVQTSGKGGFLETVITGPSQFERLHGDVECKPQLN
jgi:hypothetical protein